MLRGAIEGQASRCHSESAEPRGRKRGRERWSAMRNPPSSWGESGAGISSSLASLSPQGRLFAALYPSHPHATPGRRRLWMTAHAYGLPSHSNARGARPYEETSHRTTNPFRITRCTVRSAASRIHSRALRSVESIVSIRSISSSGDSMTCRSPSSKMIRIGNSGARPATPGHYQL